MSMRRRRRGGGNETKRESHEGRYEGESHEGSYEGEILLPLQRGGR